jgi:hypothetical protein
LAPANLQLTALTSSENSAVSASGITADQALNLARTSHPEASGFSVYLGSFTDSNRKQARAPSESGPLIVANVPAYLVVVKGATVDLHGPPPPPGSNSGVTPNSVTLDVVVVYEAQTGAFVLQANI